jgi:hypothetical protein
MARRKRFKNNTDTLQVVYTKSGQKREIIPTGTVLLDEEWAKRYGRVLTEVKTAKKSKK